MEQYLDVLYDDGRSELNRIRACEALAGVAAEALAITDIHPFDGYYVVATEGLVRAAQSEVFRGACSERLLALVDQAAATAHRALAERAAIRARSEARLEDGKRGLQELMGDPANLTTKDRIIIVALLFIAPLGIAAAWLWTDWTRSAKVAASAVSVGLLLAALLGIAAQRTSTRQTPPLLQPTTVAPSHTESPAMSGHRDATAEVVSAVEASSEARRHPASHAFDGKTNTAWNEGAPGSGVGEWLEARFNRPVRVTHLTVTPGWDAVNERGDLFTANRYMTAFDLEFDGGQRSFQVPEGTRVFRADLDPAGVSTSRVRITARAVQAATPRWEDLCISEVRIFEVSEASGSGP